MTRWRLTGALGLGAVVVAQALGLPAAGAPPEGLPVVATLSLFGSTPTLAWSPDNRRVAVASAYTCYGHDAGLAAHGSELGVYVVDVVGGAPTRLSSQQGYHPAWLDGETVAWGHSPYEQGEAGLFVSPASHAAPRKIGAATGVYHTLARGERSMFAASARAVYFSGWPEYRGWVEVEIATGVERVLQPDTRDPAWSNSWQPPAGLAADQCLQKAAGVSLIVRGERLLVEVDGRLTSPDGGRLFVYGDGPRPGPVRGCLAPDGRHVAWFTPAPDGYELRIAAITP